LLVDVAMSRMIPDAADALFFVRIPGGEKGCGKMSFEGMLSTGLFGEAAPAEREAGFQGYQDRQAKD